MANKKLYAAKTAKFDEFYTLYEDIQNEVNAYLEYDPDVFRGKVILLPCDDPEWSNFTRFFAQNFEKFGLKKLISTSFAKNSKRFQKGHQLTFFESDSPLFDETKTDSHGKIFSLSRGGDNSGRIDLDDLEWSYLDGDGDFRRDEIKGLREEADIIITNPPFSKYIEFVEWLAESKKKFLIIGSKTSVTYKKIFPLIKENKMWSGKTGWSGGLWFETKHPSDIDKVVDGVNMKNVASVWFTNLEHGRRHQPLQLMTMQENIMYSKHKSIRGKGYLSYDNFNGIDVPQTDAIPRDYNGVMGVPISFLEKYNPSQFEIIGTGTGDMAKEVGVTKNYRGRTDLAVTDNGRKRCPFQRILIRRKQ